MSLPAGSLPFSECVLVSTVMVAVVTLQARQLGHNSRAGGAAVGLGAAFA